ncbi:MAG TPA: hypothetical protein VFT99_14375, partial [Roseiflexaceae bacterium]|nr:hypothetical protein [Roseiflexaceae bacterium]
RSWAARRMVAAFEAVRDWRPYALAALTLLLVVVCAQAPLSYSFNVGVERGPASDQPFLYSFYTPEGEWPDGMFRWSRGEGAAIEVPGVGRRAVVLGLTISSHRAQHDPALGPTVLTLRNAGGDVAPQFALRPERAHYLVLLPAGASPNGVVRVELDTPAWQNQGDSRDEIGIALAERIRLWTVRPSGLTLPDMNLALGLPLGVLLAWGALRLIGFGARQAFRLTFALALIPLFTLIDAPRLGFAGSWAITAGLLSVLAAGVTTLALPPLLRRYAAEAPLYALHWLALLMVATFVLKYGGRFYPDAMPGDWQLHINRFLRTNFGEIAIQAQHRGLPFPFPTGYYLDIAPLILLGINIRPLLPLLAGIFEAASLPVIFLIPARTTGSARLGLIAAAIYAMTAHGFMNTWFSFHTQVSTQFFTALLMLILASSWPHYHKPHVWWPAVFLLAQMFLGHIGTFINAGLLGALAVVWLWSRARNKQERRAAPALALAGIAALLFAVLCFYTLFAGLIVEQVVGVASRGLVDVSGKKPLAADVYAASLWHDGLITHYGFFPVLLAIGGLVAMARRMRRAVLPVLVGGTLLVSLALGLLPFVTHSAIMTRWLTFAAWAIAMAGAFGVVQWWRRGRAARVALVAMAGFVAWISLEVWAHAMLWRLPPVEPF